MRTYGRVYDEYDNPSWVEVVTDNNGANDFVFLTTLIQCLLLNLGESPFYANYGIPGQQSVIQQIFPDYYVVQTQTQFAPFFAALIINKLALRDAEGVPYPAYKVNVTTNQGVGVEATVPI